MCASACTSTQPAGGNSATPSVSATTEQPDPLAFCLTTLPRRWQEALEAGTVPRETDEQLLVELVAPDGSLAIESKVPDVRNELRWFPADGSDFVTVHDFGAENPERQVLDAAFDGRYLSYSVRHSVRLDGTWSLYVWDSEEGGDPQLIAENPVDAEGDPIVGPFNYPVAYDGMVVWVQGAPTGDSETSLHMYDIDDGSREVLHTGHPGTPFRMGSLLIWPESPAKGELSELHALSLETLEPAELPGPIADIEGPAYIAASEDTVAWTGEDLHALWVWRESWESPARVFRNPDERVQGVHIAGDVVSWNLLNTAQFALDLRSGGYTQITPELGSTSAGGPFLRVGYAPDLSEGKANAKSRQTVVDTRDLPPLSGCNP